MHSTLSTTLLYWQYCNEGSASVARCCNDSHHTLWTGHRSCVWMASRLSPSRFSVAYPQGSVLGPVKFISHTEDVGSVFNQHGVMDWRSHLYADDKQAYVDMPPQDIATACNSIHDISSWCSSRRLQLNSEKNWTDLVRLKTHTSECQPRRPDAATWFHHHRTCQSLVWPQCVARWRTFYEAAYLQGRLHLLLSAMAAAPAAMLTRPRNNSAVSFSVYHVTCRLL